MIGDKESWIGRARKARADGLLFSFLEDGLVYLFLSVLIWILVICFLLLPIQGVGEVIYWLRFGQLANFDWYDLFGREYFYAWTATDFIGLNRLIDWALDAWISVVPSAAALILTVVIALNRNHGF
ncbi:MAG: hypothetical protein B7Z31_08390 [Rhodobacterales bacterium 12-65-15]|nr:MAG: hypothetical protein B7Z31_08390 [Rhodobacterales bacterium 12-65-15]